MMEIIRAHDEEQRRRIARRSLMRAVETFTGGAVQHDDITAVVVEYRP